MSKPYEPDYIVQHHGSVSLVFPQTPEATKNLLENISSEAVWFGKGLAVEHRFITDLQNQLTNEGWVVE